MKFDSKYNVLFMSISLLLFCLKSNSQINYSIEALTGKGDLILIGEENKLQSEVYESFIKMKNAALKEGVLIKIVSGYRSFKRQNNIWNRKYNNYILGGITSKMAIEKIVEYSTLPGTSRHHWGTDIDIIDSSKKQPKELLVTVNYEKGGSYFELKQWMENNASKFGFYLVYTNKSNRKGFKYEPWHYSYKKIAKPMLKQFIKIDFSSFINSDILEGYNSITPYFINKYIVENILDINPELK
ncbi:MAG: M15 family metallopeptidase [Lutibacter sp.]|uniref:M15 family metallopeptidase n=1 Tax=Lutibacter sp. TaxID=1925666 RepID=UPI00385AC0D7